MIWYNINKTRWYNINNLNTSHNCQAFIKILKKGKFRYQLSRKQVYSPTGARFTTKIFGIGFNKSILHMVLIEEESDDKSKADYM